MGKAKVIDQKQLDEIYAATVAFRNKIKGAREEIDLRVKKLTNPEFLDGLQGGQGEDCAVAIRAGAEALSKLAQTIDIAVSYVDTKVAGAIVAKKDKHGFADRKAENEKAKQAFEVKR